MRTLLNSKEILTTLTTNLQDWKLNADTQQVQNLNDKLTEDDIIVICSPDFYDDIYDIDNVADVIEKHFLDSGLSTYSREAFILIHNIYNY